MRLNDDGRTVAAMDVLAQGIGEIIGGSQRKERLEVLDRSMAERGIDQEHYAWYRDLRRYGARRYPVPAHPGQRTVLRGRTSDPYLHPQSEGGSESGRFRRSVWPRLS